MSVGGWAAEAGEIGALAAGGRTARGRVHPVLGGAAEPGAGREAPVK